MDAIIVKVRENGRVINKAIHLVLAINLKGEKELLGMWITQTEGAKFWMSVLTDLLTKSREAKNRGVQDIFIACIDGLPGFPEAIAATYPNTRSAVVPGASGAKQRCLFVLQTP
jgi:putative transposase